MLTSAATRSGRSRRIASPHGVIPVEQIILTPIGGRTLTSTTSQQKLFATPANGALLVSPLSTYLFECFLYLTGMSATSGNLTFSIGSLGTATFASAKWHAYGLDATTLTTAAAIGGSLSTGAVGTGNLVTAATGTALMATVRGIFRTTNGGTLIPSVGLTTAAAATVNDGTFFKCYRIGSDTVTAVGDWQ